ncbi:MAG: hypothetical protein K0R67_2435 [Paenibacillus sp.]|jgi:acetyltransferase-like isoleucine patch superfamily enzyme|nr:hypothetical protein [Paenibacillus sp.]
MDAKLRDVDYKPWIRNDQEQQEEQARIQQHLTDTCKAVFGANCFVSPSAAVFPDQLQMGDRSYIAAGAVVRDKSIIMGADCTINSYAVVTGNIVMGDGVRIASHASIYGFNHGYESTDKPIFHQPIVSKGIEIGDDVWVGANAVIVDGVKIGAHSIIAAGAIVTRDVPPYSIAGGNPAKVIRNRLEDARRPAASASDNSIAAGAEEQSARDTALAGRLQAFGQHVKEQLTEVLGFYLVPAEGGEPYYIDKPGHRRTVRAYCDATEIAGMFGQLPPGFTRDQMIARLRSYQDPRTGLVPDPWDIPDPESDDPAFLPNTLSGYHLLAVGYALEVLGTHLEHPVHVIERKTTEGLYRNLDELPWVNNSWGAGNWIDSYATGLYINARHFASTKRPDDLFGWLHTHADRTSGLWGRPTAQDGWMQPVNGFYRLTRSTYAQFGLPLPYVNTTIDTVLAHSKNSQFFRDDRGNACNVLDVIHPLWLCMRQSDYRRADIVAWSLEQIERVLGRWQEGRGFSFELETLHPAGLQGTEMWLSVLYLLADACGLSAALGYRPQGVHRLEPAWHFSTV